MNKFYVYEYVRLDINEPFYVGKGTGDRWRILNNSRNPHFKNIVNKIQVAVVILEDNLEENTAFEYEIFYIELYRDMGYNLTNICDGGEGVTNYIPWNKGKKCPQLSRKYNGFYGKHHTKESLERNRQAHLGKSSQNVYKRKVVCLNTLKIFNSLKEASDYYGLPAPNHIGDCCKGQVKQYGKYKGQCLIWRYLEDFKELSKEDIQKLIDEGQLSKSINSRSTKVYINSNLFNSKVLASIWLMNKGYCNNKETARRAINRHIDTGIPYKGLIFTSIDNTEVND
ncbi:MAG: hypothetical protein SPJ17_02360 [Anaeroplasma sp.]|uniref:hypothetical protein n=1 Tax=Anaeroplasma sp. TaxID=1872523 RepID=UPI002A91BF3D|nr:hypothetical protein [Anaeroplasma sp.]MDY5982533.1 hypothetical protein [Anaeroplasma sp.]